MVLYDFVLNVLDDGTLDASLNSEAEVPGILAILELNRG